MRTRLALTGLVAAVAACVAPAATAYCGEERPCRTACDDVADTYDRVNDKAGQPLPGYRDIFMCPQN